MKTTYVLDYAEVSKLKSQLLSKKKIVDYFFSRNRMIRWEPATNKFTEYMGLIDISFVREFLLTPEEAKKEINIRNVQYLIRRERFSEYYFDKNNIWGEIWRVCGENVKEHIKLFDEFHIIFDSKIDNMPSFAFKNVFYGNVYDYLEMKNNAFHRD